ncbi:hypothetical protein ATN81_18940 [Agrobacterium pusense]|jgi:hypothetical protein|uniref:hypothetical protein n=1 Tax=Agrobacterium pusense TaxID=648995 RepID=UPI0009296817|nr:hypothetical protein [Agrobacterium pusense]OJH53467.1 hypothetical protein ATN81_18940 [Agrobacterium pusense]OJH57776.1 hypothetical protein BA725_20845 [Agrobacterium pusense]
MQKLNYAVFAAALLCGCVSADVNMYPVDGPLSKQHPLPVVKAKAGGVESNSGPMIMTLPDKQECKGTWSSVAPKTGSVSTGALFSAYGGALFGSTVTTGILPGVNKGQAFVACNRGTTLEAEFYTGSGTANGYGIAKDSDGNVYKMLF